MFYCNAWGRVWAQEAGQGPVLTTRQLVAGGAAAQIVIAPTITAPLERIKILLQVRHELEDEGRGSLYQYHTVTSYKLRLIKHSRFCHPL